VNVSLWDVASDEARVRAIVRASPRLLALLEVVEAVGPPGAWVGAGALRNRVWHTLHRLPGEPADDDVEVAWHGTGDPAEDARLASLLGAALAAPWDVGDQARYGATSAERGMATWPETATGVAVRLAGGELDVESLVEHTKLSVAQLSSALLSLELKHRVKVLPGGWYRLL
jgi:hypothetical protein